MLKVESLQAIADEPAHFILCVAEAALRVVTKPNRVSVEAFVGFTILAINGRNVPSEGAIRIGVSASNKQSQRRKITSLDVVNTS